MDHFTYKDSELYAEEVPLAKIAASVGTPFYCYSSATLEHHFKTMQEAINTPDALICFAVKSNSNFAVIKTLGRLGAGADVVSEGEIRRVLKCGIPAAKIVFSGVGKTANEMEFALSNNVFQFNVESEAELELLNKVAAKLGKTANIALRVNPDIDAGTNSKITTGLKTSKFGIDISIAPAVFAKAAAMKNINPQGVSVHIGSQITDLQPFESAFHRIKKFVAELREAGHKITTLDLGGGLGIPYEMGKNPPHPKAYGKIVRSVFADINCKLIFEPGRVIVGNAGVLVSEVIYTKANDERNFLIIDAAMNDLIRPSFYSAHHDILPINQTSNIKHQKYDIVGPVCETGDTFAEKRELPELNSGDLIAFRSAGAYGAVMSSNYNTRQIVPEVMVRGGEFAVVSTRQSYEEIFSREKLPNWLS